MGQIFVFTELLRLTETESQLAVVLAHEISHVLLSHAVCSPYFYNCLTKFHSFSFYLLFGSHDMDQYATLQKNKHKLSHYD